MNTTAIATITPPVATTATVVVKISLTALASVLYAEAIELVMPDRGGVRLPRLTENGVKRVQAWLADREPRGLAAYVCTVWMPGNDLEKFPAATRRTRLLRAMAGFLPGSPWRVAAGEGWFAAGEVRGLARACRATPEEAAGFVGLQLAGMCPQPA